MNGVEVRIVQVSNRDTELGAENEATENSGAVELWRDGERIVELVWWEMPQLHTHLTYDRSVHHETAAVGLA